MDSIPPPPPLPPAKPQKMRAPPIENTQSGTAAGTYVVVSPSKSPLHASDSHPNALQPAGPGGEASYTHQQTQSQLAVPGPSPPSGHASPLPFDPTAPYQPENPNMNQSGAGVPPAARFINSPEPIHYVSSGRPPSPAFAHQHSPQVQTTCPPATHLQVSHEAAYYAPVAAVPNMSPAASTRAAVPPLSSEDEIISDALFLDAERHREKAAMAQKERFESGRAAKQEGKFTDRVSAAGNYVAKWFEEMHHSNKAKELERKELNRHLKAVQAQRKATRATTSTTPLSPGTTPAATHTP